MDGDTIKRSRLALIAPMLEAQLGPQPGPVFQTAWAERLVQTNDLLGKELREVARACRAEDGGRRERLANDLTAIIRLYEMLSSDQHAPATVAGTDKMFGSLAEAIIAARDMNRVRTVADCLRGPAGVAALRHFLGMAVEEILRKELGDVPRGLGGVVPRVAQSSVMDVIDAVVVRHLLASASTEGSPLADVLDEFQRRLDAALEVEAPQARLGTVAAITAMLRRALVYLWENDAADDPLYDAADRLQTALKVKKGWRNEPLTPRAEEGLIWSVALLIKGWKSITFTKTGKPSGPMNVSLHRGGWVHSWAALFLNAYGFGKGDISAEDFDGTAKSILPIFRAGIHPNPFSQRSFWGLPGEEDYLDQLARKEIEAGPQEWELYEAPMPEFED